jgi:hypothetical protein
MRVRTRDVCCFFRPGRPERLAGRRRRTEWTIRRIAHPLPFLFEARVDRAQQRPKIQLHLAHFVRLHAVRHCLAQRLVDAVQVTQQQTFGALELVVEHILGKRSEVLEHLARD